MYTQFHYSKIYNGYLRGIFSTLKHNIIYIFYNDMTKYRAMKINLTQPQHFYATPKINLNV